MILQDLLLELGTEELPSASVKLLSDALAYLVKAGLEKASIAHGKVRVFATPRRLAVLIEEVASLNVSKPISRRGPAVALAKDANGNSLPALLGFALSCGVSVEELKIVKTDKGEWYIYETMTPSVATIELLPSLIEDAIKELPIAKPMRWGNTEWHFVRPLHWVVLLFGNEIVKTQILGVETTRFSFGHRYHHPAAIEISNPRMYEEALSNAFVVSDFSIRREKIKQQVLSLAEEHNLVAIIPDSLLDEVTSIVEWPQALLVGFEESFLEVPKEALIAAMQVHQKCFALEDSNGKLSPYFITIANIVSKDPEQVILGNEKVMRARLSDAAFFYNNDKKVPLENYIEATKQVVFQNKLGSIWDKTSRMKEMMQVLSSSLAIPQTLAKRATELCKCDLLTGMVGEFPELQGIMGYYYAKHFGEDEAVAVALRDYYLPRFATDALGESNLSKALSLADRLDTMVGLFAIGQKPTGVKDPFKLRRHALAIVRLLISIDVPLSLTTLLETMREIYADKLPTNDSVMLELRKFILERLQSYYQGEGFNKDLVNAVRLRQDDWLFDIDKRIKALESFLCLTEAKTLSALSKRVNNLLQHAKDLIKSNTVDVALLQDDAERELFATIEELENEIMPYYTKADYEFILTKLARLSQPVDNFFAKVLVMVDDVRLKTNRLCLLSRLQGLLTGVADISLVA